MDLTIRNARPEELEAAGELTARAYLADGLLTFGEHDPYLASLRDARRRAGSAEVLVAADRDGGLLGCVTFAAGGEFAEIAAADEAEFRMLAVRPGARGLGAGQALVRACVERAAVLGRRRLVLSALDRVAAAQRLYLREGFVRSPARDWEPEPGTVLRVFSRELRPRRPVRPAGCGGASGGPGGGVVRPDQMPQLEADQKREDRWSRCTWS